MLGVHPLSGVLSQNRQEQFHTVIFDSTTSFRFCQGNALPGIALPGIALPGIALPHRKCYRKESAPHFETATSCRGNLLPLLSKWHKPLYYKKLDKGLILGRIKSYFEMSHHAGLFGHAHELGIFGPETQRYRSYRAVALFGDDQLRFYDFGRRLARLHLLFSFTVQEHHDIRVLFNRA